MKIWVHGSVGEEITFVRKWGKNSNEYDKGGGVEIKKGGGHHHNNRPYKSFSFQHLQI